MPKLYLIRHGEAEASWNEATDPGLSVKGQQQALDVANKLRNITSGVIISSPLLRCRETAEPLESFWQKTAHINEAVSEIPSPGLDMTARTYWLQKFFDKKWVDADQSVFKWRDKLIHTLIAMKKDAVIFTHFVAINAAVGHAIGSKHTLCFRPDNCSVTEITTNGKRLSLVTQGAEARTQVN